MAIELKNVSYTYLPQTPFERQALKNVNLSIDEGVLTAIAGHTGSGKSTLLQHLNGLLAPTQGEVLVDGVNLQGKTKQEKQAAFKARQAVGMVFQYAENQLFEETVAADIAFGPKNQKLTAAEIDKRVHEAMKLVGLDYDKFAQRVPFQLSGGQMRRVAIAGVLAMKPKYLVLDEPAAGLDPAGKEALIAQIKKLQQKNNMTIVLVSHSMEDIASLADSIIIMHDGKVLIKDSPRKVFNQTALLAKAGLKRPQIMDLLAKINASGIKVNQDALTINEGIKNILEGLQRVK